MGTGNDIYTQIVRLFSGGASREEMKNVERWLELSVENRRKYEELKDVWLSCGAKNNIDLYDLKQAIEKFRSKIQEKEKQRKIKLIRLREMMKYAAIVILLLALPFSYYMGTRGTKSDGLVTTITCAYGDKTEIVLPDSSRVWLNSGSKMTFNNDFTLSRKLILEGEAYFSVTKNEKSPFQVATSDLEVEVTGTEFNVSAYPDDNFISASLVEGRIRVSNQYGKRAIEPNQKLVFDKTSRSMHLYELQDMATETDWIRGRLVFREESLENIKLRLERWFDVDVVFADEKVKKSRFTGMLEKENVMEAVFYFNHSSSVSSRVEGKKIIFYSK
jgi:ferric-dicitrate binding protein FerR (iron transport regulator)